jgi:ElaB/YqjD/DUF883 family membrane-anchored ribosome-binding protein
VFLYGGLIQIKAERRNRPELGTGWGVQALNSTRQNPGASIMADTDEPTIRSNGAATSAATAAARPRRRAAAAAGTTRRRRAASANLDVESDTLEDQVAQLRTDLKSITNTLQRMGHTGANEIKANASARADELASRGQSALDYAQDEFGALEKQIKDTIREKPLTAVAGAVALGFLLAVITR